MKQPRNRANDNMLFAQAKALSNLLQQNLKQYEAAFGEIRLEAQTSGDVIQ